MPKLVGVNGTFILVPMWVNIEEGPFHERLGITVPAVSSMKKKCSFSNHEFRRIYLLSSLLSKKKNSGFMNQKVVSESNKLPVGNDA